MEYFNSFMELDKNNNSKLLNNNIDEFMKKNEFKREKEEFLSRKSNDFQFEIKNTEQDEDYIDLTFDYRHTFIKISEFVFHRGKNSLTKEQIIKLNVSNGKIMWNKFNKDVFFLIIFKNLFLFLDKIVLKDSKKDNDKDKDKKVDITSKKELSKKNI